MTHRVEVRNLTEGEAAKVVSRLDYMKKTGVLSEEVTYESVGGSSADGLRVSTYGGL